MLKWCLLRHEKTVLKYKYLTLSVLCHPLIIREFVPEGESARKYSLIFRGRTGNPDQKIKICLQFESATICFPLSQGDNACSDLKQQFLMYVLTAFHIRTGSVSIRTSL